MTYDTTVGAAHRVCPIFAAILLICTAALAQNEPLPPQGNTFLDRTNLGIKLGINFPNMTYSNKELDNLSTSIYANGLFELFGEYSVINSLSARPGLKYTTRGQHIDESLFSYEYNASYFELALPVAYTFQAIKDISPYLLVGPVLGFAIGGDIRYKNDGASYKTEINKSNSSSCAFGLHIGTGLKYPLPIKEFLVVLGFEVGYHLGLTDTYSDKELDEKSNALNANDYGIDWNRKNRGLELGITFAVPLSNFKKPKPPEPEPPSPPPPPPEPLPETEKPCHTIDEIKELLSAGQDIRGKKICAIEQVNFKFGSAELLTDDKVYLDQIVVLMKTNELINVKVNGHTDNVGSEEFNMNLSRDRAKSVQDYLESKGINASRLSFEFFGSTRPIASNDTEGGRAINRRVEFEITNQ